MDLRKLTKLQMISLGKTLFFSGHGLITEPDGLQWSVDRNRSLLQASKGSLLFVSVSRRQLINIAKLRGLVECR